MADATPVGARADKQIAYTPLGQLATHYVMLKPDKPYNANPDENGDYKMPVKFLAFQRPLVKWAIVLMVLSLVVAWIVMIVGAKRLHEARKLGEWKQQECGREYMEAETARYEMSRVYETHVRRYIYVALAMFMFLAMTSLLLMTAFSAESGRTLLKMSKFLPDTGANVFERPGKAISLTVWGAFFALLAQTSTLSGIWGDRMSEKSYTEATTYEAAIKKINTQQMPGLIQGMVIGTLAMIGIVFVMYAKVFKRRAAFADGVLDFAPYFQFVPDAPPLLSMIVLIFFFVAGLALTMALVKSYGALNARFTEYGTKTDAINDVLRKVAEEPGTKDPARDYLLANIRRVHPDAELSVPSALDNNYGARYYGYAMHEDGTEVGFLNTNRVTLARAEGTIAAIKDYLPVLVLNADLRAAYSRALDGAFAKVAANAKLLSDTPEISIEGLTSAIGDAFRPEDSDARIPVYLNDALRFEMHQLLKADATDEIKVSSVREAIQKFVEDKAQKLPNMGTAEIMGIVNTELFAKTFKLSGEDLDNAKLAREDTKRDDIVNWFKCDASRDNGLCRVILLDSLGTYMQGLARVIAERLVKADDSQGKIRDAMSELRTNPLPQEADGFIRIVYVWSLILVVLFAYVGFHLLYRRNPGMVTVASVSIILGLVLVLSFYGWFMGQATL